MKTEFKAKFLSHLAQKKKNNEGFTLIELLVVIIIIGILAAIALPAFLNQASKAKQSEAKTNIGSLNRGQQAYFLEQGKFTTQVDLLGLGIPTQTTNYKYEIDGAATDATIVTNQAQNLTNAIKAYIGGVKQGQTSETSEATTLSVVCEALKPKGVTGAADGTETVGVGAAATAVPECPTTNYKSL
ncbi:MAG TPA: type IV pilin-like G/H family protein [Leptolyngbyaceae cyanobacterium M33_DOE_097]|uniref:Prepilin-type N-terminal cleavage/methylation domain-containing protein n=1 Tax=Oscillatoriales cyanobacterium SpSt-418 TaxID=2282169 RepID=A0A7C3PNU4_9CYAN|nr:type IV pilin-like G/H family protein [Leptolyngbyaceae cyanobacterium M33_DOE_097]